MQALLINQWGKELLRLISGILVNGFTTKAKATPWRLPIISDNLNDLVNNTPDTMFHPVNEEIRDAAWIEPGKAVWFNAYNKKTGEMDVPEARRFFEASNALGIIHDIIGSGWRKWGQMKKRHSPSTKNSGIS